MRFFLAAFFSVFFLFSAQINTHASIATTPKNRIRAQNFFSHNRTGAEPASARKPRQLQALFSDEPASDRCDIRYTYDKASRISTVTIPAQHRELRYVYDGRGNKVNTYIRDTRNNRFTMQAFEYDALNRLTYAYSEYYGEVHIEYFDGEFTSTEELRRRVTYPSGIKAEFYHDAFDRPIRIAWIKDDNQIMAHSYEYDSFDRIIRKTVDSPSGQRQENYSFDLADRLIAALTPEGTINYDYDQNDNMTSIYHSGNAERQVNFVTDNQYQELLTGASYPAFGRSFTFGLDALGRRITDQNISNNALHVRTYAFDPMSRLSAVSSVKAPLPNAEPWPAEELEYSYLPGSPLRRTLTKQQPAQTTRRHFIWDGANELESLSEFTASGNTDYFAEIFLSDPAIMDKRFGAAKNQNAFLDEGAEGIDYITDQQNTINASYKDSNITDEQHFSPYGQPVTFTLPEGTELTKFAYTGRNYDAPADLYYYRGRYYDACSARFLNPDPIENRLNWTGYVGGDPVNMVDPSGYVGIIFEGYENYTQEDWQRIADESEKRRQESSENFAQAMDSWVGKLVMGYAGGNLIKGLKLFDRFRKKAPDSNQCLPSNESQLNNPLEEIIKRTRKIDGRLETSLDDGSKIIFRRDIGQNAHPIGKKYQNPVDHFNIEIHKPVKNHLGRFKQTKDVHIIVNDKLEVIDVIMK